ncbi:MAG: hypothetical protein Q4E06_13315 [Lautropia sp.]|nr:hypothetical protein [Lautropia sp.]
MNSSPQSGIQVHRVSFLHGWRWLRHGFSLLGMAPRHLLLLMLLMVVISNLLAIFGLLGAVLAKLLVPVMLVGYLATLCKLAPPGTRLPVAPAAHRPVRATSLRLEDAWRWTQDRKTLFTVVQLGLVSLVIDLTAYFLSGYGAASEATLQAMSALSSNQTPDPAQLAQAMAPMLDAILMMMAITLPCHVLMWFAPVFAGLHRLPLLKSLVFSAVAVSRNLPAFFCYGFSVLLFTLGLALLVQLLNGLLGGIAGMAGALLASPLLMLLMPVILAVLVCSQWACYLDTVAVEAPTRQAPALPEAEPPADDGSPSA